MQNLNSYREGACPRELFPAEEGSFSNGFICSEGTDQIQPDEEDWERKLEIKWVTIRQSIRKAGNTR